MCNGRSPTDRLGCFCFQGSFQMGRRCLSIKRGRQVGQPRSPRSSHWWMLPEIKEAARGGTGGVPGGGVGGEDV